MKITPGERPPQGNRRLDKSGSRDVAASRSSPSDSSEKVRTNYTQIKNQILKIQNELSRDQVVLGAMERSRIWLQKRTDSQQKNAGKFLEDLVDATLLRNDKVLTPYRDMLEKSLTSGESGALDKETDNLRLKIRQGAVELSRIQIAVENRAALTTSAGDRELNDILESVVEDLKKQKTPELLLARERVIDLLG